MKEHRMSLIVALLTAVLGAWSVLPAQVVTDGLLYEFSAYDDPNGSEGGWQSSYQPGATVTLPVYSGAPAPAHKTEGTAQYFRPEAAASSFVTDAANAGGESYSSWTLELWVRRQGNPWSSGWNWESAVAVVKQTEFDSFVVVANDGFDSTFLRIDTRDRNHNRSTNWDAVDIGHRVWNHIVIAYQDASAEGATDGVLTIYQNGQMAVEFTDRPECNAGYGGSVVENICAFGASTSELAPMNRNFNGDLAFLRFYGKALSEPEAQQNYQAGLALGLATVILQGQIALQGFVGDLEGVGIEIEMRQGGTAVRTDTVVLDAAGLFSIQQIMPGTYDLAVSAPSYLQTVIPAMVIDEDPEVMVDPIVLTPGDLNSDNAIDLIDLAAFATSWLQTGDQ